MVSTEFEKATIEIEQIDKPLGNDDLLKLYALFKLARGEEPAKPGMFDMAGKYKKQKYDEYKEKIGSPAEAEQEYIKLVEGYKSSHGFDASRTTKADGSAIDPKKLEKLKSL